MLKTFCINAKLIDDTLDSRETKHAIKYLINKKNIRLIVSSFYLTDVTQSPIQISVKVFVALLLKVKIRFLKFHAKPISYFLSSRIEVTDSGYMSNT